MKKRTVVSLVLVLLIPASARPAPAPETVPDPVPGIRNVLVIVLDALRADHLGCYGYPRNTSPNIDALAANGLVFDRAIVQAGWTKPSIASYFTSTYPYVHRAFCTDDILSEDLSTMAEVFRRNGYFTYGFVNNPNVDSSLGFGRGFHVYKTISDDEIFDDLWKVFSGRYIEASRIDGEKLGELGRLLSEKSSANLVQNGGFEHPDEVWNNQLILRSSDQAHSGDYSIHIDKEKVEDINYYKLSQELEIEYGREYIFGAFVKTENLADNVSVSISEPTRRGSLYKTTNKLAGTNDWNLLLGYYRPQTCQVDKISKMESTKIFIRPGRITDFTEGEVWIDDVFLIPLDEFSSFRPSEKLFMFVHFMDPHEPYRPPPLYSNLFRSLGKSSALDRYDAEIRSMDDRLGLLLEGLEERGILNKTLVIITSDHGQAFGEHGYFGHGSKYAHIEVARVPLIFSHPGLFPSPKRRDDPVEASVDLLPSLIDLLGLTIPESVKLQGISYFTGSNGDEKSAGFYQTPAKKSLGGDAYLISITDGRWHYISNLYSSMVDDTEISCLYRRKDKKTVIRVGPPENGNGFACESEEDLRSSRFFAGLSPEIREELLEVYRSARGREEELYDLRDDPREERNVVEEYPEQADRFRELIRRRVESDREALKGRKLGERKKAPVSRELRERLRSLGYFN